MTVSHSSLDGVYHPSSNIALSILSKVWKNTPSARTISSAPIKLLNFLRYISSGTSSAKRAIREDVVGERIALAVVDAIYHEDARMAYGHLAWNSREGIAWRRKIELYGPEKCGLKLGGLKLLTPSAYDSVNKMGGDLEGSMSYPSEAEFNIEVASDPSSVMGEDELDVQRG